MRAILILAASLLATTATAHEAPAPATVQLPMHVGGRSVPDMTGKGALVQWPGIYFESRFEGDAVTVRFNDEVNNYKIYLDGQLVDSETRPGPGDVELGPLPKKPHTVRMEKINESQGASPAAFPGFFVRPDVKPLPAPQRTRQIEFIGDSYTVGYGNTSKTRTCTGEEIWQTTDTSQAFGPLTAKHFDADYQVNALSGHGIVRNYNGAAGDPVPVAYPYVLFDKLITWRDPSWAPQIIVIGLGTNDFSTPLNASEKWATREALHADYEAEYVRFVQSLRAKNPGAYFILMATDQAEGEIQAEVKNVMTTLQKSGESRIAFIPMNGLGMTGCDWHPDLADDKAVAALLTAFIDAHPELWQGK